MFKGKTPSTHQATDATWSKWIALIMQRTCIGNPNRPGILEIMTNWTEGENFSLADEKEEEEVDWAEEAPAYSKLPEEEIHYALFTDGSCRILGMKQLKAVHLALNIAEREKWPKLYLYTDLWMVTNALCGWLDRWKKANWKHRRKPIWASDIWQDISTQVEKLIVRIRYVDAHVPKNRASEEHCKNEQADRTAQVEVSQVDLDWQHKGEFFLV
ncbi:hypothetical protein BTVI_65864 [Pitangus sulphuratus]|nr:hypothetical protein BTVI_65864 [Pitangus sulphuratus]